jgi:hypothetical protein
MLSTRLSAFLNSRVTSSIQVGREFNNNDVVKPERGDSFGCESSIKGSVSSSNVTPSSRSTVISPITVSTLTTTDEVEERLQHVDTVGKIRSRRETALLKYQSILIKRSAPKTRPSTEGSGTRTRTKKNSKKDKDKLKRPKRIQRNFSEIDERDESSGQWILETKTSLSSRDLNDNVLNRPNTASLPIGRTGNFLSNYADGFAGRFMSGDRKKPKPHMKGYAEEYNTLVGTVVDLVANRNTRPLEDADKILKSGQLKKVATMVVGIGFDTFVEVKKGIFRYYEDVGQGNVKIRSIPLRQESTRCRATKHMDAQPFNGWSSVFELIIDNGGLRIFWMTKSEDDRDAWIEVINDAIVTDYLSPPSDSFETNSPAYNADIVLYLHIQGLIRGAASKDDYLCAISLMTDKKLLIPVNWLKQYSGITRTASELDEEDLWRQLLKGSIAINGQMIKGAHCERAISTLTSHIVDIDNYSTMFHSSKTRIKESQAVLYARDILLSCGHETRVDDNHSLFCVEALLRSNFITVSQSPSDAEPLKISVRRINTGSDKYENNRVIQNMMSGDSLCSGDTEQTGRQSLDLSSCAEESIQESVMNCPSPTIEVTIKVSNIYRICTKRNNLSYGGDTLG